MITPFEHCLLKSEINIDDSTYHLKRVKELIIKVDPTKNISFYFVRYNTTVNGLPIKDEDGDYILHCSDDYPDLQSAIEKYNDIKL